MTITITVEDDVDGERFLVQKQLDAIEVKYAQFDLVFATIDDLVNQINRRKHNVRYTGENSRWP
jgi:hypothetical protein